MEISHIQWTKEDLSRTHGGGHTGNKSLVWLSNRSSQGRYMTVNISKDLCVKAGFEVGDTVWLYSSGNMFMIKKEPSDFVLRSNGYQTKGASPSASALRIGSVDFAAHFKPHINGDKFEAWVDNGAVLCRPKES